MRRSSKSQGTDIATLIAIMLLIFYGLPFIGLYLLAKPQTRFTGGCLIAVGILLWIIIPLIAT